MFSGLAFPALEYGQRVRNTRITAHLPGVIASNGTFEYRVMRAAYTRYTFTIPAWSFSWSDRETLLAFWNQIGGKLQSFLWQDGDYNSFSGYQIGTGTQLAVPAAPTIVSTDLKAGTIPLGTHNVTVTALNAQGETTASPETATTLSLTAPTPTVAASTAAGVLAAGTYDYGLVAHTATGYSVLGATASVTTTALTAPTPAVTSSTAAGTLAAGTYEYALVAHTAAGYSLLGPTTSITTTATGENVLSWAFPANVTSVDVYGRVAGSLGLLASGVTATTWTDTGSATVGAAAPTTATVISQAVLTWSFPTDVTSVDVYGRSGTLGLLASGLTGTTWTDTGTVTPGAAAPTTATATGEIKSSWTAVTGATSYNVYRDNTLAGNTTGTTFTDTGASGVASPTVNGTGTTTYPLVVPVAGALHPIWHPDDTLAIESGGVGTSAWQFEIVNQQPAIVFPAGSCPLYGDAVTASGGFSFAVRFNNDLIYTLLNAAQPQWAPSVVDALEMIEVFE